MTYTWENEALEKYGEEITLKLIDQQKRYEEKKHDNDCNHCGIGNQGSIVEMNNGTPILMRYGLWSYSEGVHKCRYCGRKEGKKSKLA